MAAAIAIGKLHAGMWNYVFCGFVTVAIPASVQAKGGVTTKSFIKQELLLGNCAPSYCIRCTVSLLCVVVEYTV